MTFDAERVALELIAALRGPLERLAQRDRALADEARRAVTSIAHNISEGRRRGGKDRAYHWSVAAGSGGELRSALAIAVAWGYLCDEELAPGTALLDRVLAMTYRLVHPKRLALSTERSRMDEPPGDGEKAVKKLHPRP